MFQDQEARYYVAQEKIDNINTIIRDIEGTVDGYLTKKHKELIVKIKDDLKELYEEFEF